MIRAMSEPDDKPVGFFFGPGAEWEPTASWVGRDRVAHDTRGGGARGLDRTRQFDGAGRAGRLDGASCTGRASSAAHHGCAGWPAAWTVAVEPAQPPTPPAPTVGPDPTAGPESDHRDHP